LLIKKVKQFERLKSETINLPLRFIQPLTAMLQQSIQSVFVQLTASLNQLTDQQYSQPCTLLSGATVGQHLRHIIELFQCLEEGYDSGIVNYEHRKRDNLIETSKSTAVALLEEIYSRLNKSNKVLILEASYDEMDSSGVHIQTNYHREIAYNLEHTIHHMALVRIGISEVAGLKLPESFGVAPSTTRYKQQCAQ
jgi:hypothetical protein